MFTQAAPVQNTWYEWETAAGVALGTQKNVRIIAVTMGILTANETLAIRITIDGVVYTTTVAATFATNYYLNIANFYDGTGQLELTTTGEYKSRPFLLEGRSLKIEFQKTTATGAGNLVACVKYAKVP